MNLASVRSVTRTRPLAAFADQRDNNLNLMRVLAAALVIFGHSYPLSYRGGPEPLQSLTGIFAGTWAVDVFFVISGFLVTKSYLSRQDPVNFAAARFLRIYPGLLVALLSNVLLLGALFTTLPLKEYLGERQTWAYLIVNLSLPGVFQTNPYGAAVNGSLWTIKFEVAMYVGLLVVGIAGVLRRRWLMSVIFAAALALSVGHQVGILDGWLFASPYLPYLEHLGAFFGWGVVFFVNRDRIPMSGLLAAGLPVLTALLWDWPLTVSLVLPPVVAYVVLWLAFVPRGFIRKYNRLGDYSYGLYIYAFPIQQSLVALLPNISPLPLTALALPLTLIPAVISWHFVEKPMLRLKDRVSGTRVRALFPAFMRREEPVGGRDSNRKLHLPRQISAAQGMKSADKH